MKPQKEIGIGIIGGGLMGREMASAFARWCAIENMPVKPVLKAVADLSPEALEWFGKIPSVEMLTKDYKKLLVSDVIDVVYIAVPHQLHEKLYCEALDAGKDLLVEKPFGINLAAAQNIAAKVKASGQFVRCSSEFPYFPGAQELFKLCKQNRMGRILEINAGFHHSSDLDPNKGANWKRKRTTCGDIGVMGDLGMHVFHIPLRLGWKPNRVHAQLQHGYPERPGPDGTNVPCDTWDNAVIHSWVNVQDNPVPMRCEMKRMAPGATNTWFIEVLGTEGGARFSTAEPKDLWTFSRKGTQSWSKVSLGFSTAFKTITGGIFEVGFSDVIQQMWAAYLFEREGELGDRFACASPEEAVQSHRVFAAALESQETQNVIQIKEEIPILT